jgi:hypothetical protein
MRDRRFFLCLYVTVFLALPSACMETAGLVFPESNWVAYPLFTFIIPVFVFMQAVPTVAAIVTARFVYGPRFQPRHARGFWRTRNVVSCVSVLAMLAVTVELVFLFSGSHRITRLEVRFALLFGAGAAWVYGNLAALLCLMAELRRGRDVEPTPPAATSGMGPAGRSRITSRGAADERRRVDMARGPGR